MLYFVGLGIDQSLSLKSLGALRACEFVYYESYTSPPLSETVLTQFSELPAKVEIVKREFVEDGRKLLENAKKSNVALVCSGDPMVATTHQELRTRAIKEGIESNILHGSSILCSVSGELGLHSYNFGRVVTITREPLQYTAYNTIYDNLFRGLHTTILLEWDESHHFFLEPRAAIKGLEDAERDLRHEVLDSATFFLVASRLGSNNPKISGWTLEGLKTADLGAPPHVLVLPGKLHYTELEALGVLLGRNMDTIPDNSRAISKLARRMVQKYTKKTMDALARAKKALESKDPPSQLNFGDVFENVECYTRDSERFLNEGRDELAVLSIGYAEGLLDSLRFSGLLEFEW
jgi:diphthine synthase